MASYSLTLQPYGKSSIWVELSDISEENERMNQIPAESSDKYVFSDLSYIFILSGDNASSVQNIRVYINDVYEPSEYKDGQILFSDKALSDRRIFGDCYGFVKISLLLLDSSGNEHLYSTEYLPVLVKRGELNDAVKAMASYVYSNQELLFLNGELKAKSPADLKEDGYQNLSAQIILAEEIAALYESSYSFFKANSRFRIEKVPKIDWFDHLQYVTPASIQFISTHPEELRRINGQSGIRMGRSAYQPEKTLSMQSEQSQDIYENQIVLGFLRQMVDAIEGLCKNCRSLIAQIPGNENYSEDYVYSSFFVFSETKKMLEDGLNHLITLRAKFGHLWMLYSSAVKVKPALVTDKPKPSHIFLSIPQYNRIFVQIYKWFRFGIYDFKKEKFMLSQIKISSLYEGYLLIKMALYFQDRGYERKGAKQFSYLTKQNWRYKNTNCLNTFYFMNDKHKLTLYYQPVVYDLDERDKNGIDLIRNNSLSGLHGEKNENWSGGHYYSPDYLIKVEDGAGARYLILDAKFSNLECVRRYHIRELAFKYLFSMSPIRSADSVVGLCILYGKSKTSDQMQSVYDKQLPNQEITPIAELLPMMENIESEKHYTDFDVLMRKAFFL